MYSVVYVLVFVFSTTAVEAMTICEGFKGVTCPKRWQKQNKEYLQGLNVPTRTAPVFYKSVISNCDYKHYKPGNISSPSSRLKAPMAEIFAEGMMQVLEQTDDYYADDMPALGKMNFKPETLADRLLEKTKNTAPELGITLGVFGSVVGKPIRKEIPTIEDILTSVDQAVEHITNDVTAKMENLKGYVNSRFLEDRKNYLNKKYEDAFDKLKICLEKEEVEKADECQEQLYEHIFGLRPEYSIWAGQVMIGKVLDDMSVRELEAGLVPARNFANLIFLILKPLIEVYRSKAAANKAEKMQKLFEIEMVAQVEYFTEYFLNAASLILKYHENEGSTCNSLKGIHCSPVIMAGSEHTHECSCKISKSLRQHCLTQVIIDVDERDPHALLNQGWDMSFTAMYMDNGQESEVAKRIAQKNLERKDRAYKDAIKEDIQKFLDDEILSFLPVWVEYKKWALNDDDDDDDDYDDEYDKKKIKKKKKKKKNKSAYGRINRN